MKIFVGGSKMVSYIDDNVRNKFDEFMNRNHEIIIGDCWGVDAAAQKYFFQKNYKKVIVYTSGEKIRNNIGMFDVCNVQSNNTKGYDFYRQKDIVMANDADCGFMIWDGNSRGTLNNIINLVNQKKFVEIYLTTNSSFHIVAADKLPRNVVLQALGKVTYDDLEDVMNALK